MTGEITYNHSFERNNGRGADIRTIYVASQNNHKINEIKDILRSVGFYAAPFSDALPAGAGIPDIAETGATFEENAIIKADYISKIIQGYVIADDSGLSVDALDGAPGIFSARFAGNHGDDRANNTKLINDMANVQNRSCKFVCVIALSKNGKTIKTFRGEVCGKLGEKPIGDNGFGYDPLFLLPSGKTMAQLSSSEKNRISHRHNALELLKQYLIDVSL